MTTEKHNVEFKESWRDEYLKWICGFANAQGGTGAAMYRFLLRSQNLTWDKLPEPKMTMEKLNKDAIALFRKHARHGKRMSEEELQVSDEELVEKLKLVDDDADSQNGRLNGISETINDPSETINDPSETINETINGNSETVKETCLQILSFVANNKNVNSIDLLQHISVSRATLFRAINFLSSSNVHLLSREGARKTGHYILTEDGKLFYEKVIKR